MNSEVRSDIEKLIDIAGNPTGQGRKVANLLLSWWNAETCGGFDPTDLWCLDLDIRNSAMRVLTYIAKVERYPDKLGYGLQFERLVGIWRPHLLK